MLYPFINYLFIVEYVNNEFRLGASWEQGAVFGVGDDTRASAGVFGDDVPGVNHTWDVAKHTKSEVDEEISGAESSTKTNRQEGKEDRENDQENIRASISGHCR